MIATPSDDILMKFAAGALDPALALLVDKHIALHPQTQDRLADWRRFGGLLLAAETAAPMSPGSLDRALARIDAATQSTPVEDGFPPLESVRWRWAGPGRAIANIDVPHSKLKSYALRIAAGKAMPQHSHAADEWTLIVQGSYRDESGEFHAGSFIEKDEQTDHRPVATGDVDCICLAVMSGPLSTRGLVGKVAQWMMR